MIYLVFFSYMSLLVPSFLVLFLFLFVFFSVLVFSSFSDSPAQAVIARSSTPAWSRVGLISRLAGIQFQRQLQLCGWH